MKFLKAINVLKVLGSLTVFLLTISESTATAIATTPTSRFERAVVTAHIARELNQPTLSPALKSALLAQARPEDVTALKSLLARYKPQTGLKFSANFNRLLAYDKSSRIVFSAEIDPNNPKRFAINGREWILPDSGSILSSLNKTVFKASAKKSAVIEVLFPFAHASQDTSPASVAAAYVFVSSAQRAAGASEYLDGKNLHLTLLPNRDTKKGSAFAHVKSIAEIFSMSPIKVQCTPAGAKGFARFPETTTVEFLVQKDLSVILKSEGLGPALKFMPQTLPLISQDLRQHIATLSNVSSRPTNVRAQEKFENAERAFQGILGLCTNTADAIPLSDATKTVCDSARNIVQKEPEIDSNTLFESVEDKERKLAWKRVAHRVYQIKVEEWFDKFSPEFNELINEFDAAVVIVEQTGTIEACKDQNCTQTVAADINGFRVPPRLTEESVREALNFKPQKSPDAKTGDQYIQYSCPTENQACKQLRIVNGDKLSGSDLVKANELASAANKDLAWNQNDPSISQPVSVLRALGPCCEDAECRAKVVDRGADLIPTGSSSPKEVAK